MTKSAKDKRTKGAWIIGHSMKLRRVEAPGQFNSIETAGKTGTILSVISATNQGSLTRKQLENLADANGVKSKLELPSILELLEDRHLIQQSKIGGGIDILGLTHGTVLERTSEIFDGMNPETEEIAALDMSEKISAAPVRSEELQEYVSDTFKISTSGTKEFLNLVEDVGFVDAEELDTRTHEKLYFNGNIFRVKDAKKTQTVLSSLSPSDQQKIGTLDQIIASRGYSTIDEARAILDSVLFSKLQAIAIYDVNVVANGIEEVHYITKPGSFSKFGNPWEEDTLDYAKALVACLAYGITRSSSGRGRIVQLSALLSKLIRGEWLGENTAAGQDYKYLEIKRVIETTPGTKYQGTFQMRLLKVEVGIIALEVLTSGESSSESLLERLPAAPVSKYVGPETNRVSVRKKKEVGPTDRKMADMLDSIRTGRRVLG